MKRDKRIYVMIAAYCDDEIIPTLANLFARAVQPELIDVCVCWQGAAAKADFIRAVQPGRVWVIPVPPEDSLGLGWARMLSQSRYDGQGYAMQLDAHHRFRLGWDDWHRSQLDELIRKGHDRPAFTAYAGNYNFSTETPICDRPCYLDCHPFGFAEDGAPTIPFSALYMGLNEPEPRPARFASGHYLFTVGEYTREYLHDPYTVFRGEELAMAVRLFTMGYDLFHPHQLTVWHRYERKSFRGLDFTPHETTYRWNREAQWFERLRFLTGQQGVKVDDVGSFGLGDRRTLQQYEEWAGIHFASRSVVHRWEPKPHPTYEDEYAI